jgi:hypothetical protein
MRKEFDEIIAPFVTKNIQYFKYNFLLNFNLKINLKYPFLIVKSV